MPKGQHFSFFFFKITYRLHKQPFSGLAGPAWAVDRAETGKRLCCPVVAANYDGRMNISHIVHPYGDFLNIEHPRKSVLLLQ
jgi:hypothetical protein